MLFEWDSRYEVNIKKIDEQHKKLVSYINELHEAMEVGEGIEILEDILESLLDYTLTHFSTEENIMNMYGYPGYEEHQLIHTKLTTKVKNMHEKFLNDESLAMTLYAMKFLTDWLRNHILIEDKKYEKFLKDKGVE